MKNKFLFVFLVCSSFIFAQSKFEVSTIIKGPYKIFMLKDEAGKLAGKKIVYFEDWEKRNEVIYENEKVKIQLSDKYDMNTD